MKLKILRTILVNLVLLGLILSQFPFDQRINQISASEEEIIEPELPREPSIPGRIEGRGKYFEINDSEFLNVLLKSSEEIKIVLVSIPKIISLSIESTSDEINSTILTIEDLEPNKIYFKYQNGFENETIFVSDENGNYTFLQEISQPTYLWIVDKKGSILIPSQCELPYGVWDEKSLTCTLNQDLIDGIVIQANSITLDCNNHIVDGENSYIGIPLGNRRNVTIKNCIIKNFTYGIYLSYSYGNIIENNKIFSEYGVVILDYSSSNTFKENAISSGKRGIWIGWGPADGNEVINNIVSDNWEDGFLLVGSSNNVIRQNKILDNAVSLQYARNNLIESNLINNLINERGLTIVGLSLVSRSSFNIIVNNTISDWISGIELNCSGENKIYHNNFINNTYQAWDTEAYGPEYICGFKSVFYNEYPDGGNYWSDYIGKDEKSGPDQDQPGNDGIGDTPYKFTGGQDNYPFVKESNWEAPPEPEKWAFAILTDLHIGFDIPDYDGDSYNNTSPGQDYYLSRRLEAVINRINELKDDYKIKFVAVLGDISDTAESSELLKARNILNKLNDPNGDGNLTDGIPYIPLIGNHDVWPYTQKEGIDPDRRKNYDCASVNENDIADPEKGDKLGDEYFEEIFWDSSNKNLEKIKELFDFWIKEDTPVILPELPGWEVYLQNYAFSYKRINFVGIDNLWRGEKGRVCKWWSAFGHVYSVTSKWIDNYLADILLSHAPSYLPSLFKEYSYSFAGHVHFNGTTVGSIVTEAVKEEYTNVIRIVQIKDVERPTKDIDYSKIEGIPKEIAPDDIKRPIPYIISTPSDPAPNEEITFIAKDEAREEDIKSCKWDFGDGIIDESGKCEITHSYSTFILWRYTIKVTITYIDDTQRITEKSVWVKPKFKLKVPQFIIPNLLFDETINVAEIPQNTPGSVLITKMASEQKPIGIINVHFEQATEDINLFTLVADTDLITRKSILYMFSWPEVIEEEKILFIPSSGIGTVYICPKATSLDEVKPTCQDKVVINVGETKNGMTVDTTTYNDREYYLIFGIIDTGGGEVIPATIDFDPDVLNLKSKGEFVTVYVELPQGFDINQIDISSIILNGLVPALVKPMEISDYDNDGISDLMVKFERNKVQAILSPGEAVTLSLTGKVFYNGSYTDFEGSDVIGVTK